jgi:molybdate transport system substrate-binding protein
MKRLTLLLVAALAACSPAPEPEKPTITVYADSALTEAFTRIGQEFEASEDIRVKFLFGASSALQNQMGPEVDVFASASQKTMPLMSEVFARNQLVVAQRQVRERKGVTTLHDLAVVPYARCVDEAPCGAAAKDKLQRAATNAFRDSAVPAPEVLGQDVKETLGKLTAGEVDAALVYATDVKANPALTAVPFRITVQDEPEKADLDFPIAVVSGRPEAKKFYDHVFTGRAQAALTDAGFELP